MTKTEQLLRRSEICGELAETAEDAPLKKRFERLAQGWKSLAKTQAWLDGEPQPLAIKAAEESK
jgi:hypothetical protein